jgi:SAM-dependent methyltransferase
MAEKRAEMQIPGSALWEKYKRFHGMLFHAGRCNVCGNETQFFYTDPILYRESLVCGECLTTSRYRSIARGILKAIQELTGIKAASLAELPPTVENLSLKIYDTQPAFYWDASAYPIPDLLSRCQWIESETSVYRPNEPLGFELGPNVTNQNLEELTFPDNSFDLVITSDVMEHVRLDNRAHQEIRRVLKPGGVYIFTVPHFRHGPKTIIRVEVIDAADPTKDEFVMEKEYHGDANSEDLRALSYRSYGTELDDFLNELGFTVDYCNEDFPEIGIMNTELFFCRLSK